MNMCTRDLGLAALPNGSRLSCGRRARGRKELERQTNRLASDATQFVPTFASARQLQALVRRHRSRHTCRVRYVATLEADDESCFDAEGGSVNGRSGEDRAIRAFEITEMYYRFA